jgi:hypothetical protein
MHESCVGHETYFSGSVKEIATKYVNLKYILVLKRTCNLTSNIKRATSSPTHHPPLLPFVAEEGSQTEHQTENRGELCED